MSRNWFIAWPVEDADQWLAALAADAPSGIDFLDPADLHVTLAFLAAHDDPAEKKMTGFLRGLPLTGLNVTPGPFVALPQPRRFSAIAATIDTGRLELEKQINRWMPRFCREAGASIDPRPTLPHLTLARPTRRIRDDERDDVLAWIDDRPLDETPLTLAAPAIYRWAEKSSSRRYEVVRV